jgi:gamma-glutamylcyclotransferase (GGCT)/AIG2-like uncharacterized protein YtfP
VAEIDKPAMCPDCGSSRVATIIYGMPDAPDEAMRKQLDEGTITFGGCCINPDNPTWVCSDCGASDGRCPYFAYGSNMDTSQMRDRCPHSRWREDAELDGYRFIINSHGVATIVQDDSSTVYGLLWETTDEDEKSLDVYEGVKYGLYSKEYVRVRAGNGKVVKALAYIAAGGREGEHRDGYMSKILKAAAESEFPETYLAELRKWIRNY